MDMHVASILYIQEEIHIIVTRMKILYFDQCQCIRLYNGYCVHLNGCLAF